MGDVRMRATSEGMGERPPVNPEIAVARDKLLALVRNNPRLIFARSEIGQLRYDFPQLRRPDGIYKAFDKLLEEQDAVQTLMKLADPLKEILSALHEGSQKLQYAKTSEEDWSKFLRFAGDQLVAERRGTDGRGMTTFRIVPSKQQSWQAGTPINESAAAAEAWFFNELMPSLFENERRHQHFVVGNPGSGKSTLLKWLINANDARLRREKTVFSRFEFMKFLNDWNSGDTLEDSLDRYVSYVIFRDIIRSEHFQVLKGGGYGPYIFNEEALRETVCKALSERMSGGDIATVTEKLAEFVRKGDFKPKELADINPCARALLVWHFAKTHKIALVLDGLDHLSVEDALTTTSRTKILRHLLANLNDLATFKTLWPGEARPNIAMLCIIRENTLLLHSKNPLSDVDVGRHKLYRVKEIDARVATYNTINRSISGWVQGNSRRQAIADRVAPSLMASIDATMRIITRSMRSSDPFFMTYEIFGGNFRVLFTFMRRLLKWFMIEGVRDAKIRLLPDPTRSAGSHDAEGVLDLMVGSEGLSIMKRRKYRIIEILLYSSDLPWFENAIYFPKIDRLAEAMRGAGPTEPSIHDNKYATGIFDNVFNYHTRLHAIDPDAYGLLEKIRIIQLVSSSSLTFEELETEIAVQLGYASQDLLLACVVLLRSGLIRAEYAGEELRIAGTARGKVLTSHLIFQMTYLEHVFHQTLFPLTLLDGRIDNRRDVGIDGWVVASIRNCFMFLCFIDAVERNSPKGTRVPDKYQLVPGIKRRLATTLSRIAYGERHRKSEVSTCIRALDEIETLLGNWRSKGLIGEA